jgi:hypothetical protein
MNCTVSVFIDKRSNRGDIGYGVEWWSAAKWANTPKSDLHVGVESSTRECQLCRWLSLRINHQWIETFGVFHWLWPVPMSRKRHVECSMSHDKTSGPLLYDTHFPDCLLVAREIERNAQLERQLGTTPGTRCIPCGGTKTSLNLLPSYNSQQALAETSELLHHPLFAILYDTKDESHATKETLLRVFLYSYHYTSCTIISSCDWFRNRAARWYQRDKFLDRLQEWKKTAFIKCENDKPFP